MKSKKRFLDLIMKFLDKIKPITDKCVRDNVFAIAGQSAFFIICRRFLFLCL